MAADQKSAPSYRKHRQSGQAIVTLADGLGGRRDVLLGKYGTKASRMEYARVIAEWEANGRSLISASVADITITELIDRFWKHVEEHYRKPNGDQTTEVSEYRLSLRPLNHLYGATPAKTFGPLSLKAVRQAMIAGYTHPKYGKQPALARKVINKRIGRIQRMFSWGVEHELLTADVVTALREVDGLRRGRSAAREMAPVRPVAETMVRDTLPHLRPPVDDMVQLQLVTGTRPGELVIMRALDIDMTGKVWLYRPGSDQEHGDHKTAWRGHQRIVPIGPRGQEIVRRHLKTDLSAYLFSPRDAAEGLYAERKRQRKSKVTPSQAARKRKRKPRRSAGDRYTVTSYAKAVARACDDLFPPPAPLGKRDGESAAAWKARLTEDEKAQLKAWRDGHRWHPNQLRHAKATELRREAGLDAARVILGHRSPVVTEIYAEADMQKAIEVAAKLG